jgi:hypothetical protein
MTATMPADEVERLRKVLALLASPHDGEALAALSRVRVILNKHKLRPEDLLGLGSSNGHSGQHNNQHNPHNHHNPWEEARRQHEEARRQHEEEARRQQQDRDETARRRREDEARWHAALTLDDLIDETRPIYDLWEAAKFLLSHDPRLPQRSMEFLRDLVERGYRGRPSEKQAVWFRDLARTTRRQVRDRGE